MGAITATSGSTNLNSCCFHVQVKHCHWSCSGTNESLNMYSIPLVPTCHGRLDNHGRNVPAPPNSSVRQMRTGTYYVLMNITVQVG